MQPQSGSSPANDRHSLELGYEAAAPWAASSFKTLGALVCLGLIPLCVLASSPETGDEVEEVVVTGSRIPMPAVNPLAPVIVLERADIERGGADSIGQVLQALPANTGSPPNTNVNNGGDGSTRIDLRGLGPARALVLLNGIRLPNGGVGADASVDLNSIPISMIDHVEVLTSGGSAVYGADAVSGVVNLITRKSLQGIELDASRSLGSKWDGGVTRLQGLAGFGKADQANAIVGVDYTKQVGVTADERGYSAVPVHIIDSSGIPKYLGGGATAYGPTLVPDGNALSLPSGIYDLNPGASGKSAGDYHPFSRTDTFNYEPYNYLQTPNERTSVWMQGAVPLRNAVSLFAEGLWSYRTSSQRLAPTLYGTDFDGAPTLADGSQGIPANNYYNPFGVDIPFLRRRFSESADRGYAESVQLWRIFSGLRGTWGTWRWQVAAGYAKSNAVTTQTGLISTARLLPAIGPSGPDAAGNIVCGIPDGSGIVPTSAIVSGCEPLNLFGGPSAISPAQVRSLEVPLRDHGENSQRLVDLSTMGHWASVRGEPVAWAAGFNYLRDEGRYEFDPLRSGSLTGSGLQADVPGGSYSASELYGEARVPLWHDSPAMQRLDLSAGARYSRFSTFGTHLAWQGGLRWEPLPLVSLRANYGVVFRVPDLAELYQAQDRFLSVSTLDPCGNSPSASQRLSCAAHGVPGGQYTQDPNLGIATLSGGNPHLDPEHGTAFDVGVDVHWNGAVGGRAGIDFFRTALKGYISQVDNQTLLAQCVDDNLAAACAHIERNADGSIRRIVATQQNFGRIEVRGLDFDVDLSREISRGRLRMAALATYLMRRDKQPFDDSIPISFAGGYDTDALQAFPHWRALGHLTWQLGPWQLTYAAQFIGRLLESVPLDDGSHYAHRVPSVTYHDIESAYEFGNGSRVRLGISNLTNRDPPFIDATSQGNTDAATYRLLGRTYFLELRYRWR